MKQFLHAFLSTVLCLLFHVCIIINGQFLPDFDPLMLALIFGAVNLIYIGIQIFSQKIYLGPIIGIISTIILLIWMYIIHLVVSGNFK